MTDHASPDDPLTADIAAANIRLAQRCVDLERDVARVCDERDTLRRALHRAVAVAPSRGLRDADADHLDPADRFATFGPDTPAEAAARLAADEAAGEAQFERELDDRAWAGAYDAVDPPSFMASGS